MLCQGLFWTRSDRERRAMRTNTESSFIDELIQENMADTEFKAAYEAEVAAEQEPRQATQQIIHALVSRRKQLRWTQRDVAAKLQVSQARVAQIEKLKDGVSAQMLVRYSRALGLSLVPTDDLHSPSLR